jgi:hypothetical protein
MKDDTAVHKNAPVVTGDLVAVGEVHGNHLPP